jgi:hypothetical protein
VRGEGGRGRETSLLPRSGFRFRRALTKLFLDMKSTTLSFIPPASCAAAATASPPPPPPAPPPSFLPFSSFSESLPALESLEGSSPSLPTAEDWCGLPARWLVAAAVAVAAEVEEGSLAVRLMPSSLKIWNSLWSFS